MDASVFTWTSSIGIGCVMRNSASDFLAARAIPLNLLLRPKEVEAMSVKRGFYLGF